MTPAIHSLIAARVHPARHALIQPDATWEDLGLDALDVMDLAMAIEDEFSLSLTQEVIDAWHTVADVERCIGRRAA